MIILKNKKPNFKELFLTYINTCKTPTYYDYYDDWYDDYSDFYNEGLYSYPYANSILDFYEDRYYNKSNKRKHKSVSKHEVKSKVKNKGNKKDTDIFKFDNLELMDSDKMIYFYHNVNNPDKNVDLFYSVYDFDQFLTEHGIEISDSEIQKIINREISHCCLDPISLTLGMKEILSDNSYGSLRWACAESNEELANAETIKL